MLRKFFLCNILTLIVTSSCYAVSVEPGDFSSSAIFESFEGYSPGSELIEFGPAVLLPVVPFTFDSGIILISPNPNPTNTPSGGIALTDFSLGPGGSFSLNENGRVEDIGDVPFGSAFLGRNDGFPAATTEFVFEADVLRAGAYVTSARLAGGGTTSITMEAFNSSGTSLGSHTIPSVDVSLWSTNFIGLESEDGIRKIVISGDFVVIDGLTIDVVVPEPTTFVLAIVTLCPVAARRRR